MHARERADDLQMAELLGADVHQQVFACRILAVETLDRILHGGGKLAVGSAELLQQHIAELRIGLVDPDGVHELLDVVIHASGLTTRRVSGFGEIWRQNGAGCCGAYAIAVE